MKRLYAAGAMTLRDFRVERNGNGRDFDIVPVLTGSYAHAYQLTFELLDAGAEPIVLYSTGSHLDAQSTLRYYVPQRELRQRFPALTLNRPYAIRASVTLDVGTGGSASHWSPQFIESVFPARERTQSITKRTAF